MQSSSGLTGFIQTYGSLILAIYAILQVWAVALWKKYVRKGILTIFEMGKIQVGFGPTPMITLNGTFKTDRKDVFLYEIKVVVTRERDGSAYNLDWLAFKAPTIKVGDPTATTLEVPSGISVRLDQPYRYSIIFCNLKSHFAADPQLLRVKNAWKTYLQNNLASIQQEIQKGELEGIVVERYFIRFAENSPEVKSLADFMESVRWLEEGDYRLKMEIKAAEVPKGFFEEWKFRLDKGQSEGLTNNFIALLNEVCFERYDQYYSAIADYMKTDESDV